ncbi:MAG: porin [Pseudomonadota bacterium]
MKKPLIALAVLAAAGTASAQSSVQIFGTLDVTLVHSSGSLTSKTQLANSGLSPAAIGFRGVEDLGGGMLAGFWLEASANTDEGIGQASNSNNQASGAGAAVAGRQGLVFNRRSTVSIGGNWGELRLGRDFTPSYWNIGIFDPFGNNGVAKTLTVENSPGVTGVTGVRASNAITYTYGQAFNNPARGGFEGFGGSLSYYLGENNSGAATSKDGNGVSGRAFYRAGPLEVAVSSGKTEYVAGDIRQSNVGASYDFGVAKLIAHIARDKNGAVKAKGAVLGGSVVVGPTGLLRASYSTYETDAVGNPKSSKVGIGYVYSMSKRTTLFTTAAKLRNSGGAAFSLQQSTTAPNNGSRAFEMGVRHVF